MAKYVPSNEKFNFEFDTRYTSPDADKLNFAFQTPPYKAPKGNRVTFDVTYGDYVSPQGNCVAFNLVRDEEETPPSRDTQYVYPQNFDASAFGIEAVIRLKYRKVLPIGLNGLSFGVPSLRNNTQHLKPIGFDALGFSRQTIKNLNATINVPSIDLSRVATPSIINFHKNIYGVGFAAALYGRPTIYNLRKYVSVSGVSSNIFGTPYLQGGVKYVRPISVTGFGSGTPLVINTKADQFAKPTGIAAPTIPKPNVSPQILTVRGIFGTSFGSPYVQRNPNPIGWISERFGTAWVSRSPRYYEVSIGIQTQFGAHKIFDAKQTITPYTPIVGGVFGDIKIRNINFKIAPISIEAPQLTDWVGVENRSRYYGLKGFDNARYGVATIRNGTPSLTPNDFDSSVFGKHLVAERVRRLNLPGFNLLTFGQAVVTKTPQITPNSIQPINLGLPTLTLHTRYLVTSGRDLSAIGQPFVAMARRGLKTSGLDFAKIGEPNLTHGVRELLVKGFDHSHYGTTHRVWFRVRSVAPKSIFNDELQYNHMVGGSRHIAVKGFDASLFGKRITPEHQTIAPSSASGWVFGTPNLTKTREYLNVVGFATSGLQPADRWGKTSVYNSRQYIVQTFDIDSELNPPKMIGWTSIVNRNRYVGPTGSTMTLFGRPAITNKATPMLPKGLDYNRFGTHFVSERVRKLRLEGMEPPYISGWTNLHNAAAVLKPSGFATQKFGNASVTNTRRYFPRIGNFETMIFGQPMISFKIRNLKFESRYSIGPIYIPIHKVDLYSRYVETSSKDFSAFGLPALSIHKKIITPRWTLRDLFGDVQLRNVTPEVKTRGRNAEEFGTTSIRTQWREVKVFGDNAQLFGKPIIAFRDRTMTVTGFNAMTIGPALNVRGTASPPLSKQHIYLNDVSNRGESDDDDTSTIKDGFGIKIPLGQVSEPSLRTNVLRPSSFVATLFGATSTYSNGIRMEDGIKLTKECGTPSVQLSIRSIGVEGINNSIVMGSPRLSPHTIFAVMEAPQQAKDNNPPNRLHFVNSDNGTRPAGEVFGQARIRTHNPYLNPYSVPSRLTFGQAKIELSRRKLEVEGIRAYRFGWHSLGDGSQKITTRIGFDNSVFGKPNIVLARQKQSQILVSGVVSSAYGNHRIEMFHRTVKPIGLNALGMGSSRGGTLYMPQSLHVGPKMPVIPVGNLMERFGATYIGLRVRDVGVIGFDSCLIEYDPLNFEKRMKVIRGEGGVQPKPTQKITAVGFDALRASASNVKSGVHYIRPDGNSDQFRKGGW